MRDGHIRRPGEGAFAILVVIFSLVLLWQAIAIDGFSSLSSAGALPIGAAGTMVVSALIIAFKTLKSPKSATETFTTAILPGDVAVGIALIAGYALLLVPLGFLPTSFLFLALLIKWLSGRSAGYSALAAAVSLIVIYLVFRIVFQVIMPEGIVPEARIIAWLGKLLAGGN